MKFRALAWLILIIGMVWCRAGFVQDVFLNIDEAEYAVAADALHHGWLPGVDLLGSTKPPGIVFLYWALFGIFGRSVAVIHAAHILILVAAGMLLVEIAIRLWNERAAIPAAVLFWMVSNSFSLPHEIAALNVEPPGLPLILGAVLIAWTKPRSIVAVLCAGFLLGFAAMIRQSYGIFLLPVLAGAAYRDRIDFSRALSLATGFLFAWIPVLIVYALRSDGLTWAWDSWVRYPLEYSQDAGIAGFWLGAYDSAAELLVGAIVPSVFAIYGAILLWRDRRNPRSRLVFWIAVASVIAVCSGSRFFGHYWIQAFPMVALLGVPAWMALAEKRGRLRLVFAAAILLGSAVAILRYPLWRHYDPYAPPSGISFYALSANETEKNIAAFVQSHTQPDETITVWGYCPQIYYHANRLPGARDYLCHYITGFSAGTFDPTAGRAIRSSGHTQAEHLFVSDLERRKPKYVFDLWPIHDYTFTFRHYPVSGYKELATYLRANYLPEGNIDDALVYRRRTAADTWWPSDEKSNLNP